MGHCRDADDLGRARSRARDDIHLSLVAMPCLSVGRGLRARRRRVASTRRQRACERVYAIFHIFALPVEASRAPSASSSDALTPANFAKFCRLLLRDTEMEVSSIGAVA